MNKLLTYQGAQPVYLGDIDFMQDAAGAGFLMLAKAFTGESGDTQNAILQGVEITRVSSTQTHVSAGVVLLNGELLPVEEATINVSWRAPLYFHVDSVLSSERTFKDGSSHKCHDTRSAYVNGASSDGIALAYVPRIAHLLENHVYEASAVSGNATEGKLIIKNGIWFMDIELDIPQDFTSPTLGSASFSGISFEHMNSLEEITFAAPAVLLLTAFRGYVLAAQIAKDAGSNTVSITLFSVDGTYPIGAGNVRALVPCFGV